MRRRVWPGLQGGISLADRYELFVGIDWATELHQVCVIDAKGEVIQEFKVRHDGEAIVEFGSHLLKINDVSPSAIAVAIETPRGAVVDALLDRGVSVFSINPKQLDRFRDRHTISGAKDDRRDAFVLADSLRTDLKLYRQLVLGDPTLVELREMARAYEEITADVLSLTNRLREQLHRYFPQFLELGALHDEAWLRELLALAATPQTLGRLRRTAVQALLRRHRIRRIDAASVLSVLRRPPLPVAPGVTAAASAHVALLLPRLNVAAQQRDACYSMLEGLMLRVGTPAEQDQGADDDGSDPGPIKAHRDAEILLSLPGVGILTGATMLTEASTALAARDYQSLRTQCGLAPVTHQTGKRRPMVSMLPSRAPITHASAHRATLMVVRCGGSPIGSSPLRSPCSNPARYTSPLFGWTAGPVRYRPLLPQRQFEPSPA
jgi:transposase